MLAINRIHKSPLHSSPHSEFRAQSLSGVCVEKFSAKYLPTGRQTTLRDCQLLVSITERVDLQLNITSDPHADLSYKSLGGVAFEGKPTGQVEQKIL